MPPDGYPRSSEAIAEPESACVDAGNLRSQVAIEVELTTAKHKRTTRGVHTDIAEIATEFEGVLSVRPRRASVEN